MNLFTVVSMNTTVNKFINLFINKSMNLFTLVFISLTLAILLMYMVLYVHDWLEPSKFNDLLNAWFPENGNPPSAFLIDTSEEALLLPDWLKLRMIRSSVMRLVDAGMCCCLV